MAENQDPLSPRKYGDDPPTRRSDQPSRASEPLQELLTLAENNDGDRSCTRRVPGAALFQEELELMRRELAAGMGELGAVRTELERVGTADRVLSEMHTQCRKLSEQFHEREVLGPVFRGLISVTDRCRQQARRIEGAMENLNEASDQQARAALRHLLEARNADRVEIENLLAHLGVEPFEHAGRTFDPTSQKCIGRVESRNGTAAGRIVSRELPGYRRNGMSIRPEYVKVYANSSTRIGDSGGQS